jgi:hypothetical protein
MRQSEALASPPDSSQKDKIGKAVEVVAVHLGRLGDAVITSKGCHLSHVLVAFD